jgi:hypothetical protein
MMTEQEISSKCKSLDASNDTFKNIIKDCKNPKFNNLDKWQHFQAMAFKKENNPNIKNRFIKYKRGTVVMVNFGTSIGNELSGNHFAIVLNKKDSPKAGEITVLPLTSKANKSNINLGNELIQNIFSDVLKSIQDLVAFSAIIEDLLKDEKGTFKYHEGQSVTFHDSLIEYYCMTIKPKKAATDGTIHYTTDEIADIINKVIHMLQDITDYYNEKNKDSFAKILSITTISKHRIKKSINVLDPIGKIQLSNETMDRIDTEIVKAITNIAL